jgi:hypothetical protein
MSYLVVFFCGMLLPMILWYGDRHILLRRLRVYMRAREGELETMRLRLLNAGLNVQYTGRSDKGLLQLIEENKPHYLTTKQTLEELLKRVDN